MLEALKDIEIASRLVGFDVDSDDPLDEKYKKLNSNMVPLPHDSEDYQLIKKYLLTTHAPTHTVGYVLYCILSITIHLDMVLNFLCFSSSYFPIQ